MGAQLTNTQRLLLFGRRWLLAALSAPPAAVWVPAAGRTYTTTAGTTATGAAGPVGLIVDWREPTPASLTRIAMTQGTLAARGTLGTAGGLSWVDFDGTNGFALSGVGIPQVSPWYWYVAYRQAAGGSANQSTLTRDNAAAPACYVNGDGTVAVYWNGFAATSAGVAVGTDVVTRWRGTTAASGTVGTRTDAGAETTGTPASTTLGSWVDALTVGAGQSYKGRFYGGVLLQGSAPTAGDDAIILRYLAALQGRVL